MRRREVRKVLPLLGISILTSHMLGWVLLSAAAIPEVVFSEIAWMGTSTSPNDEWIELYNNTSNPINLDGWVVAASDGTPNITLSGIIPAHGYFLLERTDDSSVPGVAADFIYTGGLGNNGENLTIKSPSGALIDSIAAGDSGWPSGYADPNGRIPMARIDLTGSGSQTNNWTYNPRCGNPTNSSGISYTCTLSVTEVPYPFQYEVYFNPLVTATTTTLTKTPMELRLIEAINHTQSSIAIAMYGLNRQSILDALIDAHNRGVSVQVVGDDGAASTDYTDGYQLLIDAGIPLVLDASASIQHNKFAVFDREVLWTGSTNFTDTGFTLNANNSIIITDTQLAEIYLSEFDEMWTGNFHEGKQDNTPHLIRYSDGTVVETFFSPTDLVAWEVWAELGRARSSIHFAMFFWTDSVLSNKVINQIENHNVLVSGVWDKLGAANTYSADDVLCSAGARIKIEDFAGKVHHKFVVIDVFGNDPTVITGSYNLTSSGAYDNDENTLIIHNQALSEAYYKEWQSLWSLTRVNPCNPYTVYLPTILGD